MKSVVLTGNGSGIRSLSFSEDEQWLILGALAETIEEKIQPYSRQELTLLCRLHRRMSRVFGFDQDYLLRSGKVVAACDPSQIVAASRTVSPGRQSIASSKVAVTGSQPRRSGGKDAPRSQFMVLHG